MSGSLIDYGAAALVGLGLFMTAIALFSPRQRSTSEVALERLGQYNVDEDSGAQGRPKSFKEMLARVRTNIADREDSQEQKGKRDVKMDELAEALDRADITLRPTEWRMGQAGIGLIIAVVAILRLVGSLGILGLPIGVLIGAGIGFFGGNFAVTFRQNRRLRRFENQLTETIPMISNSLKAGTTFPQALDNVATEASPPISSEFRRVSRELMLGMSIDESLKRLVVRNPSEDLDLLVTAVQIHRVVGGNLAETLDQIAETIRERIRIKGEVRTLTSQARASGWIISLLPILLAMFLSIVQPTYFGPMFTHVLGWIMLGAAGFSIFVGIMIIRKIVDVDV